MPRGKVLRVLGKAGEHQVEMHAILAEFGLPLEFPESVFKASEEIANGVTPEEIAKRRDVRQIPTLDHRPGRCQGPGRCAERSKTGQWKLGDRCTHRRCEPLRAARSRLGHGGRSRATSVYLVDRVVPMLPEKLSNDLCSLHADTDKFSFSAIFELDDQARIKQRVVRTHGDAFPPPVRLCRCPSDHRRWRG